jgi:hypothetical protein
MQIDCPFYQKCQCSLILVREFPSLFTPIGTNITVFPAFLSTNGLSLSLCVYDLDAMFVTKKKKKEKKKEIEQKVNKGSRLLGLFQISRLFQIARLSPT